MGLNLCAEWLLLGVAFGLFTGVADRESGPLACKPNVQPQEISVLLWPVYGSAGREPGLLSQICRHKRLPSLSHMCVGCVQVGDVVLGTVQAVQAYGAFVELGQGVTGLLHVSQISADRITQVDKVLSVGDKLKARTAPCLSLDKVHLDKVHLQSHVHNKLVESTKNKKRSRK